MPLKPISTSLQRRLALWLLVLATVFGALAPTLSHALMLVRGESAPMLAVCTSTGMSWATTAAAPDSPGGQESAPSLKSCPFCLLALDRAAPPPHASVHFFDVSGADAQPTVRPTFFYVTPFALTPPLRGPPSFS
jgi:hypothetical protein